MWCAQFAQSLYFYRFYLERFIWCGVGFGASYTGGRQIDQTNRTTAYTTESLLLGYSHKFELMGRSVPTRFQVNVDRSSSPVPDAFDTSVTNWPVS